MVDIVADRSMVRLHVYDSDSNDNTSLIDPIGFVEFCIGDIPFDTVAWLKGGGCLGVLPVPDFGPKVVQSYPASLGPHV